MFKKRLITFVLYLIGVPLIMVLWGLFIWLLAEITPIEKGIDFLSENDVWVLGGLVAIMFLYGLYEFIKWLFIEPYRNYRKNKNKSRGYMK